MLSNRIGIFANLPIDKLNSISLKHEMDEIGRAIDSLKPA